MIIVDVEGTGVNPTRHSIVSIGALELENPKNQFYVECRPWEGAEIMEEAMEVNGFTEEQIYSFPKSLEEGMKEFLKWFSEVGEHTLAGHNIGAYDFPFLMSSANRYHLNVEFAHRTIDIHSLTYMHMANRGIDIPTEKHRTAIDGEYIQKYIGIPEEPKPHNALSGAKVAAEAISRLLYDKPLLPEFESYSIPWIK